MRYYHLSLNNHSPFRINLRRALLLAALIADFFAFYTIVDIVVAGPIYVLQMLALFALSLGLRLYATTLLITYDYKFIGEKLIITRSNTFKDRAVLELTKDDAIELTDDALGGAIIDYSAGAEYAKLLKINGRLYRLALDEYMTALVKTYLINGKNDND